VKIYGKYFIEPILCSFKDLENEITYYGYDNSHYIRVTSAIMHKYFPYTRPLKKCHMILSINVKDKTVTKVVEYQKYERYDVTRKNPDPYRTATKGKKVHPKYWLEFQKILIKWHLKQDD
jgi:hypothetical protein